MHLNEKMTAGASITFPFPEMPDFGDVIEVREDLLWTRLPLPYSLDHVNIFFVRDGEKWVVIDTGIKSQTAIAAWEALFKGPLRGMTISRVLVTHYHPDHIGLAGWLCARFDARLLTSYSAYMGSKVISLGVDDTQLQENLAFYTSHGMADDAARIVATQGNEYLRCVQTLPNSFTRLAASDFLEIGGWKFRVLTGDGHAPEQIMLYCDSQKILFAADQVIERISPNISVTASQPDDDPLGDFLRSLQFLADTIPDDVLVLPGHRRPFFGLSIRYRELADHHEDRCNLIREACAKRPHTTAELVPILFPRELDPHQMSFAFTETLAHMNRLVRRKEVACIKHNALIKCVINE